MKRVATRGYETGMAHNPLSEELYKRLRISAAEHDKTIKDWGHK